LFSSQRDYEYKQDRIEQIYLLDEQT